MAPSILQHRRTHNLLLISKLLNQRDAASPFTLIFDSLEQSAKPLLAEYIRRARATNLQVIFVSFENLKGPDVDHFVYAWRGEWRKEVTGILKQSPERRKLVIFDTLSPLSSSENLPALLSGLINPTNSLLAVYHADVPITQPVDTYSPSPSTLLRYLATTIITVHSFHHVLARKAARERSQAEPSFGLEQGTEGVLQSLGANGSDGVVLEMEHRRKSGRGMRERYFLPLTREGREVKGRDCVILLEDHPLYASRDLNNSDRTEAAESGTTFELGLTDKQRLDREGVVLPYLDAQKGGGEGGRILYDMGSEDDFDEEEDEI